MLPKAPSPQCGGRAKITHRCADQICNMSFRMAGAEVVQQSICELGLANYSTAHVVVVGQNLPLQERCPGSLPEQMSHTCNLSKQISLLDSPSCRGQTERRVPNHIHARSAPFHVHRQMRHAVCWVLSMDRAYTAYSYRSLPTHVADSRPRSRCTQRSRAANPPAHT